MTMHDDPMTHNATGVLYRLSPAVDDSELNALFVAAWPSHARRDFTPVLKQSLAYICAYAGARLIGFVNLAWDGGIHAFLLDPTVHPDWQHRGVGRELVRRAAEAARERGLEWLHVDYESQLEAFYQACGFRPTAAGLLDLRAGPR
jgi:ribosomal protein S18 acetylase RimI-like enzyme